MVRQKSPRLPARDRILAAASDLFYKEGIQNVGIDRIIGESGVAKMSLYNHFKSKDALIAAWLEQRDEHWRSWFPKSIEALATDPKEQLIAIFDALKAWFEEPDFRGCAFINTTVELANPEHLGSQVARQHKQALQDYVAERAKAAELDNPEGLTQQWMILIEGAIVVAMMQGNSEAALSAKQIAIVLLAAH